jgi:hypothetical protein
MTAVMIKTAAMTVVIGAGFRSLEPASWSDPGVTRRISASATRLAQRIDGDPGLRRIRVASRGELRVDEPARPDPVGSTTRWHAGGRLVGAGPRLACSTRIEIEVSAASSDTVDVRLVPRSRHIHWWATRRQRRYFQLAHAAADELQQVLTA